ncbi:inorganic phosphate transporter [Bacillus solimangrovi]|uniref:Sulfate permease n=1 Tax=Bacillus solimangrovi TaxID=1305675 RepID=A0A1E5LF92_9BACI|nr:inorganic phosphate transporter [Bacillus solimangrovi]OEH92747.1 sulfate permease [Bacillus solimangrovi]
MSLIVIAFIVSYFFALNIGASGAAATISVAYGSGAIRNKRLALGVCAIGIFLGAIFGGGEVVHTIGKGIVSEEYLTINIVIVVLVSASLSLLIANLLGIPLSTSEVAVGAIVGVGVSLRVLNMNTLVVIIMFWLIIPIIAFLISYLCGKYILRSSVIKKWKKSNYYTKIFTSLLIIAGFIESFSAGMNNIANAVGPLVGAGLIQTDDALLTGGLVVALGAFLFGGKVVETNAKEITKLTLLQGTIISGTSGFLVIIASLFGIPIPLTQVTTTSIIGMDSAKIGINYWQKSIIRRIILVWVVSPFFSLVMSYTLMKAFFQKDGYTLFIILSIIIATLGTINLIVSIRKEKQSVHEHGGGI